MPKQIDETHIESTNNKIGSIYEQEEAVSKAFQITNFYSNERLNILELKQRLQQFKRSRKKPSPPSENQSPQSNLTSNTFEPESIETQKHSTAKFMLQPIAETEKPANNLPSIQRVKQRLSYHQEATYQTFEHESQRYYNVKTKDRSTTINRAHKKEQIRNTNYRIIKEVNKSREENKIKTAMGVRHSNNIQQNRSRAHSRFQTGKNVESSEYSRCSDSSLRHIWQQWGLEGRLVLSIAQQVTELDKRIHHLWQHYQLMTKILIGLKQGTKQEKNPIVKYVEDVCNDKFQFIKQVLQNLHRQETVNRKGQIAFLKRLRKNVMVSRFLQNLSIVYVSLDICMNRQPDSHLVNFVGYCCSNIIFLLRLVQLAYDIKSPLKLSTASENILSVIDEFEIGSYGASISRMGQIHIRLQHNNEIISIVQTRMCTKMDKRFQQIVNNFLKKEDIISKPFFEYAHYIYQFLAYHLASQDICGQFSFVEIVPSPYMSLTKQKTLVIEPWEVLFANKGTTTYIRAHTESLIKEVAKYWNIVYWTDLMPDKIDDLYQKLPPAPILYRYHCRYENGIFLKLLWRIGCDVDNTIIVDRSEANFRYDKDMGVQLPWKGQKKDIKLVELFNALYPLLINTSISLKKSFAPVRLQILNSSINKLHQKRYMDNNSLVEDAQFSKKPGTRSDQAQNYQY